VDQADVAYDIVVVGTSWGGLSALRELIAGLPKEFGLPLVVVQHRHKQSDHLLPALLQDGTSLCVAEVEDKAPIAGGNVYVAPADYHLLVEKTGQLSLDYSEKIHYCRPAIDVTFETAADSFGKTLACLLLSGANADGALGLKRAVIAGALALVQDPATAHMSYMPEAGVAAVKKATILTTKEMAAFINNLG